MKLSLHLSLAVEFMAVGLSASSIESYSALGDSYATGAGAGDAILWPPSDAKCGRFTKAYPKQIVDANKGTVFRNLACGGSSTVTVLLSQLPWIEDSKLITLTIGGNEVDFFKVVNDCIYQWIPLADCDAAIVQSRAAIESEYFRKNIERLIKAIAARKSSEARLLVTGYAKFFNDQTVQCDNISFSTKNPNNKVTRAKRAALNDLLRLLNNVIRTTSLDNDAEYIDLDAGFEGHRFCEEGVTEPDSSRKTTWFIAASSTSQQSAVARSSRKEEGEQSTLGAGGIPEFAVFHPTIDGQSAIAKLVMQQFDERFPQT